MTFSASFFLGLLTGSVSIILMKTLLEPLAKRLGIVFIPSAVAKTLNLLDPYMPELLASLDSKQLEAVVRLQLEELTGESWKINQQTNLFFKLFDPRQTAETILVDSRPVNYDEKLKQLIQGAVHNTIA